jgi:DNA-directed RNA polymerase subunit M/transcription elongation factor TFIIS
MARNIYFVQSCPTCGRNLQVRVEYLGKRVVCQHCSAKFDACNDATVRSGSVSGAALQSSVDILARADELIRQSEASGIGVRGGVPVRESELTSLVG